MLHCWPRTCYGELRGKYKLPGRFRFSFQIITMGYFSEKKVGGEYLFCLIDVTSDVQELVEAAKVAVPFGASNFGVC